MMFIQNVENECSNLWWFLKADANFYTCGLVHHSSGWCDTIYWISSRWWMSMALVHLYSEDWWKPSSSLTWLTFFSWSYGNDKTIIVQSTHLWISPLQHLISKSLPWFCVPKLENLPYGNCVAEAKIELRLFVIQFLTKRQPFLLL